MMPLCREEDIAVLPWSPLARGLLAGSRAALDDRAATLRASTDDFARTLYEHPSDWLIVETVKKVAAARHVEPAEVALAWLLSKPGVTAPIVGATKLAHLEAAIRAVNLELSPEELSEVEAETKYSGYIRRQMFEIERVQRMEARPIPPELDYAAITGLSREARERLQRRQPMTLGEASRLPGVTPADINLLLAVMSRGGAKVSPAARS